jgi:hypothetical protein
MSCGSDLLADVLLPAMECCLLAATFSRCQMAAVSVVRPIDLSESGNTRLVLGMP